MNHWKLLLAAIGIAIASSVAGAQTPHVVVIGGDAEYGSRTTTAKIADRLEHEFGLRTTLIHSHVGALEGIDNRDKSIPGLEVIQDADLLIIYVRMRIPPQEQLKLFRDYFESGKPAIGMRTTTHGFTNDRGWCPRYFGGHYWSHLGDSIELFTLLEQDGHPLLRGVPRHAKQSANGVYMTNPLGESATPLILAKWSNDTPAETYAWTNEYKAGSRQFFFTAGHPEEFDEPHNAALLYNAVFWCLGREVPPGGVLEASRNVHRKTIDQKTYGPPPAMKPPEGAVVLFDGSDLRQWDWWFGGKEPRAFELDGRAHSGAGLPDFPGARWKVEDRSAVATVGYGDVVTREHFSDYQLHLDFLIPQSPADVQRLWRGNSGVYLNGRYELQIVDSNDDDELDEYSCGAITGQRAPDEQACQPAGTWQSLDVYFRAPRFRRGRQQIPARATVVLNDRTIHDNVPILRSSAWGFRQRGEDGLLAGPIRLEADTSPVRFANVWLRPMNAKELAERLPHRRVLTGKPWIDMDYGPYLSASIEVAPGNTANKGLAIRLDEGAGGVSAGDEFLLFDTDTLRLAAGWTGPRCVDWRAIAFDGEHGVHPSVVGDIFFSNPEGPGWAQPGTENWRDDRVLGRDGRRYGPLDRGWAHWKGLYRHGHKVILSYTVGDTEVLEMPGSYATGEAPLLTRTFNVGPRSRDLVLQVAHDASGSATVHGADPLANQQWVTFLSPDSNAGRTAVRDDDEASEEMEEELEDEEDGEGEEEESEVEEEDEEQDEGLVYEGDTSVLVAKSDDFDMTSSNYTIFARIRTEENGSIFSKAARTGPWTKNGKTLFVAGDRLAFDIGWVGVIYSQREVADGDWHHVAMTFDHDQGTVQFFVDGKPDANGELAAAEAVKDHVVRIGFTSPNFPDQGRGFEGQIDQIGFFGRALSNKEIADIARGQVAREGLIAWWREFDHDADVLVDATQSGHNGRLEDVEIWEGGEGFQEEDEDDEEEGWDSWGVTPWSAVKHSVCGLIDAPDTLQWKVNAAGDIRLVVPAGDQPIRFVLAYSKVADVERPDPFHKALASAGPAADLKPWCQGGPGLWQEQITTTVRPLGPTSGALVVDELTLPDENPYHSWLRLGGFDFFADSRRAAVCTWQGDVWIVEGLGGELGELKWQRIAAGMFQPLGLKIVDDDIYVTCRDQITVLRDLNGDQETDFYQNFNNDAQVTNHFHEFATGLQTDEAGNFYYCKGGCHARDAIVPQHGTLLKVSKDGLTTEIVANGFRAPNGLLVNDDGTFILSDQEGHWTPKNRINLVRPGGFYGYMMGFHEGRRPSDAAEPITWIHNDFDRSPAEQVRVTSQRWAPLEGRLLNLSYGTGCIHLVMQEMVDDVAQGGVVHLPLTELPTGIMRGRFHPTDEQLYVCGLFGWSSDKTLPGGFYRIRYTGQPLNIPVDLSARLEGIELTFSDPLDPQTATNARNYTATRFNYRATAEYGSEDYRVSKRGRRGRDRVRIEKASLTSDGKTLMLHISNMRPAMQMEIKYRIKSALGVELTQRVQLTVHTLGSERDGTR